MHFPDLIQSNKYNQFERISLGERFENSDGFAMIGFVVHSRGCTAFTCSWMLRLLVLLSARPVVAIGHRRRTIVIFD